VPPLPPNPGYATANLTLGYLDDLTLAGPQSVVAADIQQVMAEGSKMGLCLNPSKCEVISHPDPNIVDQTMSSFNFLSVADATLLGAHCSGAKFWMTLGWHAVDLKHGQTFSA